MRVERREEHGGEDDGGEVEEDEVVVVHDLSEEAALVRLALRMPSEQRQEADERSGKPAQPDDSCTPTRITPHEKIVFLGKVLISA